VVGSWAAAGTLCADRSPVNLRSGEVESERGRRVEASVGFIGAGVGMGLAWCGAVRAGSSAGACSSVARARRTRGCVILPKFLRLPSTQTCESFHMDCVRFLPYT
jgi:F0F1-type ATP synthase membrane subunit c/vacuolar-type H+-ATPase subunit K